MLSNRCDWSQITSSDSLPLIGQKPPFCGSLKNTPFGEAEAGPKGRGQAFGLQLVVCWAPNGPLPRRRMSRGSGTGGAQQTTSRTNTAPAKLD